MSEKNKKIGIMGGTFDPVHCGHLLAAEAAREQFGLDKVWFMPTGMPPHKTKHITDSVHRINMLKLAVGTNPYFEISTVETDRPGITYTCDTMIQLNTLYPSRFVWYYIIGSDTLRELDTWRNIDKVAGLCSFIVYKRPDERDIQVEEFIDTIAERYKTEIKYAKGPTADISSTDIRKRVSEGRSIRYLVTDGVMNYIYENGLYLEANTVERL